MTTASEPRGRLAILHPPGRLALGPNMFGKDVANAQLWQALAQHGGWARIDMLGLAPFDGAGLADELFAGGPHTTEIGAGLLTQSNAAVDAGVLLRGQPELYDIAWHRRRRHSDRAYSLVGLIHTLAPPAMRQFIANTQLAPMHAWDALVCTSPSVRDNLEAMFAGWGEHLARRTGGRPPPRPALPVIPLGVNAARFAALADRPDARARRRAALGLGDDDVLVLWVGRLSYYEKAFPQPMFAAVQRAAAATGAKVVFGLAGWFPDAGDRAHYEQAARVHAPDVDIRFLDGNDATLLGELWAAGDVFLSLVDNIQETFGITPLEAMAAGLPVVASDWDGYRSTVRDGVDGFLIPTLMGPTGGGLGANMVERHTLESTSYQAYVGAVAQHTAVHIGRAAEALAALIRDPGLRRRMGRAGRARVADAFDWPVVARQHHALVDELAEARAAASDPIPQPAGDPVKGDPFRDFAGFASHGLTLDTRLTAAPGATEAAVLATKGVALDAGFPNFRAPPETCAQALALIAARDGATVREVLTAFPAPHRRAVELGLAWLAKYGFVDWLA
ncbi:MAG: glycosyltransferase family 4 protein [Phenylobacterium sp.]|uniref:glycosyltransferase family 4 protein n=1 Tax=Phenylobacterium sp. TaxID=1871053 RepID=UPI001A40F7B1|nr:glycosyltransferase family 4 protein [Phenylobacterium sp.]MBL8554828.1 glycosyltransferase family 4 protein [Phenylobacterium sp.]